MITSSTETSPQDLRTADREAAAPDEPVQLGDQPTVRVGLLEGFGKVDFRIRGQFSITTLEGEDIFAGIESDRRWRCKVESSRGARFIYSVVIATFEDEERAERLAQTLRAQQHPARILPFGRRIVVEDDVVHEGLRWRVIVGAFETEEEARPHLMAFLEEGEFSPRILRHRVEDSSGTIELYDSEYDKSAMVDYGFRIIPDDPTTEITLYDVQVGAGFHWERLENRVYRGTIEIRIDNHGYLIAINELLLDEYLKGVVPTEMHYTFPYEALKAQAVAARSYTVSQLANRSYNEPIDFPATVQFQAFSGVTQENELTSRAVMETSGEVLKVDSRVCDTYFCSNSGGHTESKEFWNPPGESYLTGIPVLPDEERANFSLDLTRERDIETWIRSYPPAYSNPRGTNINMLDRNARYFRWEVTYTRRELEDIIKRKLGFDIGTLIDIQPLTRGVSGRIVELEILGTHRNHKVYGELNIRRVLSETTLYSSCFIVQTIPGGLGHPLEITFLGAGFGHGVGMDQTAAGVMATRGMNYRDILQHFYTGANVVRIW